MDDRVGRESFFARYLDPADRLNEILFGLIMVLTFTLTAGFVVGTEPGASRELLIAFLGCNLAWGVIDGAMYLMGSLLERGRRAHTLAVVQDAPDEATALAEIDRTLEGTVLSLASDEERARIGRTVRSVALNLPPQRTRVHGEDVYGALASGLLVVLSTIPAAIPFLFIDEPWRALRVSNLVLVGLLFAVGYEWGKHAYTNRWLAGLAFLGAGVVLVGVAIALGG